MKSLGTRERDAIDAAQDMASFTSLEDFVRRTGIGAKPLAALAEAGAFDVFEVSRRDALWQVRGLRGSERPALPVAVRERNPAFAALDAFETIGWDYRAANHSPRGHPLAPLRDVLREQGLPTAREITALPDGRRVRYAGVVICRQRPGTAAGVTFMTMEDETGFVNLVVWKQVFDRFATLARAANFIGIAGRLQVDQGVTHLIAERFFTPRLDARPRTMRSRDFH